MSRLYNFFKWGICMLILSSIPFNSYGQSVVITGKVTDSQDYSSLPGVNITIKGTTQGVSTTIDGDYLINAAKGDTLVYSYIGYMNSVRVVKDHGVIDVALDVNTTVLDEMVVVGYGTSTKKELTGATSNIKGDEINKLNMPRLDQALQGQASGVTINTNSGSPGGSTNIRIRGLSTFGDNDPLILVDGIVYDTEGLNALNPDDIESINILKDGTAGIYGVRAANGVILVETKKGKTGSAPLVEFGAYYGMQQTTKELDVLNATEYAVIKNNAFANGGQDEPFPNTQIGEGTDWQNEVFQNAPVYNFNLGVSGGSEKATYSIGGSYYSQDGIVGLDKANFTRINGRINYEVKMSEKFRFVNVFLYTNEERSTLPENGIGSVLYNTINAYPTEPIRQANGEYSYLDLVSDIINPLAQMENTYNESRVNKMVGKFELIYDINSNLTFTNRFNYNFALVDGKVFSPLVWYGPGKSQNTALNANLDPTIVEIADSVYLERGASVYENRDSYTDLSFESFLNYNRTFNKKHQIKGTLGLSVFTRTGNGLNAIGYNIPYNSVDFADISASMASGGFLNQANSFYFQEKLLSGFLRAEYAYDSRYLFSAIVRGDGSSKFGENNRWGVFPAFSAAWLISEEDFYNIDAIEFFKLRTSYGVSGNDQIPNFAYRALLNGEGVYVFNDLITQGVAIGRAANPDLQWETTSQFNVGLDMTFLTSLNFTTNYFIKRTNNLLFQPDVSGLLGTYGPGGFAPYVNAGDISNSGFEFDLSYSTDPTKSWLFSGGLNMTILDNEVKEVPDGVDFIPGAQFGVGGNIATRFEVGFPIGYFIGFQTDGIYQTQAEIDNSPYVQVGAKPGDLRFVDINGDGEINFSDDSDRTMLGSPIPDFTLGLNLRFEIIGIDVSMNIYSAIGQEIIRNYERQQPYANQLDYVIERWTGPYSSTEVPRVTTGSTRNTVFSDFYVENGNFMRIRNLQIGYTLPTNVLQKAKIKYLRFYVSVNNLLTVTSYQGYDPDIGNFGGTLAAGVDYGFYPQARTIMGGFSIKF
jgi:TonB-linked SusC/RagA family outer membrane protein